MLFCSKIAVLSGDAQDPRYCSGVQRWCWLAILSICVALQAQDYRIQYDSIVRLFVLPKSNVPQTLVVVSLDPPIRKGQTYYPHILCQFNNDDELNIELDITEEQLEAKNEKVPSDSALREFLHECCMSIGISHIFYYTSVASISALNFTDGGSPCCLFHHPSSSVLRVAVSKLPHNHSSCG